MGSAGEGQSGAPVSLSPQDGEHVFQVYTGNKSLILVKCSFPLGFLRDLNLSSVAPRKGPLLGCVRPGAGPAPSADVGSLTADAAVFHPGPGALLPSLPSPRDTVVVQSPGESTDFRELSGREFGGQCSGRIKTKRGGRALARCRQALGAHTLTGGDAERAPRLCARGWRFRRPGQGRLACVPPHREAGSNWGPQLDCVSCSWQTSQVRVLWPELQTAEFSRGTQRALPQLPAEHGPPGHPVPR